MRIVSWNMRKSTSKSDPTWEYFQSLKPDVALLQEVNSIPDLIMDDLMKPAHIELPVKSEIKR